MPPLPSVFEGIIADIFPPTAVPECPPDATGPPESDADEPQQLIGREAPRPRRKRRIHMKASPRPVAMPTAGDWSLEDWIQRSGIEVRGPRSAGGGSEKWILPVCPFKADHRRGEAWLIRRANGGLAAGCQHHSCTWGWKELREKVDQNR